MNDNKLFLKLLSLKLPKKIQFFSMDLNVAYYKDYYN